MLPGNASFYALGDMVDQLRPQLRNYNYADGDSVMAIGDPSILAVIFGVLGQTFGKFYVLKWDRMTSRYSKTKVLL